MKINLYPYFKLLRVGDTRGYFLLALFGFFLAKGFLAPLGNIAIFLGMIFFVLSFGWSINDCFDQKEDRLDKTKKNPIVLGEVSFKGALFFSFSLAILGLVISGFLGYKIFLFYLLTIAIFLCYSAPPLRLKSRFLLDIVAHGLFVAAVFSLPLIIFKAEMSFFLYLLVFSFFCLSIILDLRNECEDYEADKGAGLKNTFIFLGHKAAERLLIFSVAFYCLFILLISYLVSRQFFVIFSSLALVFLILFLFYRDHKLVKDYKILDAYPVLFYALFLATR